MVELESMIIKHRPDFVLREGFLQNVRGMSNKVGIISTGTFHRVLEMVLWKYNLDIVDVPANKITKELDLEITTKINKYDTKKNKTEAKKQRRKEKKLLTLEKMESIFKVSLDNQDDIGDAFAVLYCYLKERNLLQ
jgi:hypothetical protein